MRLESKLTHLHDAQLYMTTQEVQNDAVGMPERMGNPAACLVSDFPARSPPHSKTPYSPTVFAVQCRPCGEIELKFLVMKITTRIL